MRRTGGLVAALLIVVGLHAPTASAAAATTAAFSGTIHAGMQDPADDGFWAPCATIDADHACPPTIVLTPPPTGKMAPPFTPYGDLGLASFTADACADPGTCSLVLAFSMHGYCGLATGRGSGGLVDAAGGTHQLAFTYALVGTTLTGRGATTRTATGEVGDIVLTGTVVADAAACANGTATAFGFTGDLTLAYPKLTP